jgi:hypothetical protein
MSLWIPAPCFAKAKPLWLRGGECAGMSGGWFGCLGERHAWLDAAIHDDAKHLNSYTMRLRAASWIAGSSPAMTTERARR